MSWFADYDEENYIEFFEMRREDINRAGKIRIPGYGSRDELFYMCRMMLFGFAGETVESFDARTPCGSICNKRNAGDSSNCSQWANSFCRASKKRGAYEKPNFYRIHDSMLDRFFREQIYIKAIIGEHRFNSFIEYISDEAIKRYDDYTRREIKEKNLTKPDEFDGGFVSLEAVEADPWEKFRTNKIKQGDLGCLHFSDSLFSA